MLHCHHAVIPTAALDEKESVRLRRRIPSGHRRLTEDVKEHVLESDAVMLLRGS